METNITGHFHAYQDNGYVIIKNENEPKDIPNFKWEKIITCKIDRNFIGIRYGRPSTPDDFVEGDHVKAHLKLVKYVMKDGSKNEGYRLILLKLINLD